ncbi:DoxX family protein [Flavobacterium myungsuense]|uniref:DoxX family protein n=1 Tax=Flavobacterium myungsuense TaxID=651823 RepID=A0ABW3J065_9FLAO
MSSKIFTSGPLWENGISLIRIGTGILIIMFGKELFDEAMMDDYTKFLTDVGMPAPRSMLTLAKLIELIGGVLLVVGLFTRIVVVPLMATMLTIIWYMSEGNFFNGGTASTFFLLFLALLFLGSGTFSLDYVFFDKSKNESQ